MRQRVLDLIKTGDKLFSTRQPILNLWQTIAENIYPMRANFTRQRYISEEFASFLMTGRPALAHRELSNAFSAMLRPNGQVWAHVRTYDDKVNEDTNALAVMDDMSDRLRRIMYDRLGQFVRSTKEGDKDFSAFGNAVLEVRPRADFTGLLTICHHLRDSAWAENAEKRINQVHIKRKPEARQLKELFPKTCSPEVTKLTNDDAFKPIDTRRIVIAADEYDMPAAQLKGAEFVSIEIDVENKCILEEIPKRTFGFVIPRWETVSEHQYGYSPAAIIGLPDARLLQQMTLTMLEHGQKVVGPPMIAVGEAINGAINLYAEGITYVDADYDEKTGEVLRPLNVGDAGLAWGDKREEMLHKVFGEIFFLSQTQFPQMTKEMTAAESQRLYEEFVRRAVPLFEPVTVEYNNELCTEYFTQAKLMGAFGPPQALPPVLQSNDIRFEFDTPLRAAEERQKVQSFSQALQLAAATAQVNPSALDNLDTDKGFRDAVAAIGNTADWIASPDQVAALRKQKAQEQQLAAAAQKMATGADVATRVAGAAKSAGDAAQSLQQAGAG